jgi:hypothetical protein
VSESTDPLPTDVEALHALIAAERAERDAALGRDHALSQNDRLRHCCANCGANLAPFGSTPSSCVWRSRHRAGDCGQRADDDKGQSGRACPRDKRRVNRGALRPSASGARDDRPDDSSYLLPRAPCV